MNDKDKIIDKIRKCLALASSANEHEAAAAMRQAQKLMEMHRISDTDLLAAGVSESSARAGANRKPAQWESTLSVTVAEAFGCRSIFSPAWGGAKWKFVGVGPNAEVASYAFIVLLRQLRRSRSEFISTKCKRLKPASKTRRADLFCDAWVRAVDAKVQALAASEAETDKIEAWLLQHYPGLSKLQPRDRNDGRNLRDGDISALIAGAMSGEKANLHRGVGGRDEQQRIGMES